MECAGTTEGGGANQTLNIILYQFEVILLQLQRSYKISTSPDAGRIVGISWIVLLSFYCRILWEYSWRKNLIGENYAKGESLIRGEKIGNHIIWSNRLSHCIEDLVIENYYCFELLSHSVWWKTYMTNGLKSIKVKKGNRIKLLVFQLDTRYYLTKVIHAWHWT